MSKSLKTIIAATLAATCMAAASAASAAGSEYSEYSNGVLLCGTTNAFARFNATMGQDFDGLARVLGQGGCINYLDHKGMVVAKTSRGMRFERAGSVVKSRLVRIVDADGTTLGYAQYRGYMYPAPAASAAQDPMAGLGLGLAEYLGLAER